MEIIDEISFVKEIMCNYASSGEIIDAAFYYADQ